MQGEIICVGVNRVRAAVLKHSCEISNEAGSAIPVKKLNDRYREII